MYNNNSGTVLGLTALPVATILGVDVPIIALCSLALIALIGFFYFIYRFRNREQNN